MRKRRTNAISQDTVEKLDEAIAVEITPDFDTAVNMFLRDCKIRNLSEYTVKYYRNELLSVRLMLESQGKSADPACIDLEIIRENIILYMMEELGRKESAINAKLRAVRAWLNWLHSEKMLENNPAENLSLIKQKRTIIETFDREQMRDILDQPDQGTFTGLRDHTLMSLLFETGVRLRELCDLSTSDILWEQSQIRVDGKGDKERLVPFQIKMKRLLRKYISVRGDVENDSLFVTIDNTPLTRRQVQNLINMYGKKANIKNVRCSPHTFRHTFAKMSVQNGADIFTLQKILGHASLEMVRTYVELFSPEVAANHRRFSPLENL